VSVLLYWSQDVWLRSSSQYQLRLAPFVNQARWISQSIHPYISIRRIFRAGVSKARVGDEADPDAYVVVVYRLGNLLTDLDSYSEDEICIFNAIMKLQPNFRPIVEAAGTNTDFFLLLIKKVSTMSSFIPGSKNALIDLRRLLRLTR